MNTTITKIEIPKGHESRFLDNYDVREMEDAATKCSLLRDEKYPDGTRVQIYRRFDYEAVATKTWECGVSIKMNKVGDKRRHLTRRCTSHDVMETIIEMKKTLHDREWAV